MEKYIDTVEYLGKLYNYVNVELFSLRLGRLRTNISRKKRLILNIKAIVETKL